MAVKRIGPKNWEARAWWTDPEGQQHTKRKRGFTSKAAAMAWEQEQIEASQGVAHAPIAKQITMRQLHNEYLARLRRLERSPKTVEYYDAMAKKFLPDLGDMRIRDISPIAIQQVIDMLANSGLRSATVRDVHRAMRAELNYAVKLGELDTSPCKNIDLPAEQPHQATIYSADEMARLFESLYTDNPWLYFPMVFAARYALRRGEALAVRWQDLDLDAGILHVRANFVQTNREWLLKGVKTRSSDADVALADDTVEELKALKKSRAAAGTYWRGSVEITSAIPAADVNPYEFICLNRTGGLIRPQGVRKSLQSFQRAHGLPVSSIHDLRHSYGTVLAEAGVDVVTISKAMRHSSVKITSDQYISGTRKIVRNASNAMSELLDYSAKKKSRETHDV